MRTKILPIAILALALLTTGWATAADTGTNAAGTDEPIEMVTVPTGGNTANGELLVFTKHGYGFTWTQLASASGMAYEESSTLSADLATYECVVLPINQRFAQEDLDALATYVQAGGNLLAVGEWSSFHGTANSAMNDLAEAAGSQLRLVTAGLDLGYHTTEDVATTTLTLDVGTVQYAAYSYVDNTDPLLAPGLAFGTDGSPFVASQQVGLGVFTLIGDVNVLSDSNGGGFESADNGALGSKICNGLVSLGIPV